MASTSLLPNFQTPGEPHQSDDNSSAGWIWPAAWAFSTPGLYIWSAKSIKYGFLSELTEKVVFLFSFPGMLNYR